MPGHLESTKSESLPDHLPRIEHHHEPTSCQCGQYGRDLVKIGEDVTEQLDAEPVPPAVIDGGVAAPGLLAWVMTSKYLNHLPLYRLEQLAAREQATLSRFTLAQWVGRTGCSPATFDRSSDLASVAGQYASRR